jgi:type IV pilus assembly protein PilQ
MKNKVVLAFVLLFPLLFCGISFSDPDSGQGNKISLDIKGMDIVDVLKMLSSRNGMNIVVGKNVSGRVTLFLKDVDVNDAFEIVLLANDLAYEKKGDIINVMTQRDYELLYGERYFDKKEARVISLKFAKASDISRSLTQIKTNIGKVVVDDGSNTLALIDTPEKLKEMEDFIRRTDLPLETKVFCLNYAQSDKLGAKLNEIVTKGVGSVKIDERTNKIAVTDFPEKLVEIDKIISAFDEKTSQVLIDAQVIELSPSDKFEMGVDWDYWLKKNVRFISSIPNAAAANKLSFGTAASDKEVTSPDQYKSVIDLLRTIGDTKILSSPRIIALNNQEARILVGTKDAYITSTVTQSGTGTAVTSQSVNFVDVGIKLYVTPTVSRDGFVTMKIRPEISSAESRSILSQGLETEIPIVTTSEAETVVTIKDGVTVIMGGLRKDEHNKTVQKVPLMGDLPFVGFFFRNTSDEIRKTELVILITPHIMTGANAYTDFCDIQPSDGAVVRMSGGDLITERITPRHGEEPEKYTLGLDAYSEYGASEYFRKVSDKITQTAKLSQADGKKGKVELYFMVSSDGGLIGEPEVLSSTENSLEPFGVKAVKDSSPFPPFPGALEKNREKFKITLYYG